MAQQRISGSLGSRVRQIKTQGSLILTPRVHEFLTNGGPDEALRPEVLERILEILGEAQRDRSGSFSPSAAGKCMRRQMFAYLGTSQIVPDTFKLNLFSDGRWRHLRWQAWGLQAGWFTDVEFPVPVNKHMLKGSIDGVNTFEDWLFELKGTSKRQEFLTIADLFNQVMAAIVNRKLDQIPDHWVARMLFDHLRQIHRYFIQSQLADGPTFHKAVLMYEDKLTQEFKEFDIHEPVPWLMEECYLEVAELRGYAERVELPTMLEVCEDDKGSSTFKDCPYRHVCPSTTWNEAAPERRVRLRKKVR